MNDQAEALRQLVKQQSDQHYQEKTKFISVTSGKGGVGKSNFSLNFSLAMQRLGKRVLVIDADIGMANIDVLMGTSSRYNLYHLVKNEKTIWDIISVGPEGLHYIAGGSGLLDLIRLSDEEVARFGTEILKLQGQYDYIIFDTGAGLSKETAQFITASDETIVVTTPEPTSITDAYALIKMVNSIDETVQFKIVVNRSSDRAEGERTATNMASVTKRFLNIELPAIGYIYDDPHVSKAVKKQVPLMILFPESNAARAINQIAMEYLNMPQSSSTGIKGFLHKLLKRSR
ncbi:MinD/ParA family protein [Paenibacillus septentrionalis]|uniref:MinD/ParA family protein n=1 Tax=Paenibacillus septentrionalis TaxID=429342 RepID=A0ABW1V1B0_9BACL